MKPIDKKQLMELQFKLASAQVDVQAAIKKIDLGPLIDGIQAKLESDFISNQWIDKVALVQSSWADSMQPEIIASLQESIGDQRLKTHELLSSWNKINEDMISWVKEPLTNLWDSSAFQKLQTAERGAGKLALFLDTNLAPALEEFSPLLAYMAEMSEAGFFVDGSADSGAFELFVNLEATRIATSELHAKVRAFKDLASALSAIVRILVLAGSDERVLLLHRPSLERGDHLPRAWITELSAKEAVLDRLFRLVEKLFSIYSVCFSDSFA